MRSYRDLCGIARALDVVGERWALLVVRELIFGPKRFADLHRGLPGMSQNVLTQRLRDLEESGVVARTRALPPTSGVVYELTGHGRDLEPVLMALGRWGSPLPPGPDSARELSPDALIVALRTTFDPSAASGMRTTVQIELPGDAFALTIQSGRLDVVRGDARAADAVLNGHAHVDGDAALLTRFLSVFDDHRDRSGHPAPPPARTEGPSIQREA
jgi:DNA-binding HxlR family transcriptional regulator